VVLLAASLLSTLPARAADDGGPAGVVQALYQSALKNFGFDPDTVKVAKPWLTPGLYARLWKKANEPVPEGDAPDIEGDVFLDAQDLPTRFDVEPAVVHEDRATVGVRVYFSGEKRHYTVLLDKIAGAWKVSDVDYGPDGKLTDLLK
jgi:hypothetical protein